MTIAGHGMIGRAVDRSPSTRAEKARKVRGLESVEALKGKLTCIAWQEMCVISEEGDTSIVARL